MIDCKDILKDLLVYNAHIRKDQRVVVIYDRKSPMSNLLTKGYVQALESLKEEVGFVFELFEFSLHSQEEWADLLYNDKLVTKGDLVILVQSSSFRISTFRVRMDLNQRGIFVIEHVRLSDLKPDEFETYVSALSSDLEYYRATTDALTSLLKDAKVVKVFSKNGGVLSYEGPFEDAKRNIGDFSVILGSLFPVGEVFTEPLDLSKASGVIGVHAIPSEDHKTLLVDPFSVTIEGGEIVSHTGGKEFEYLLDLIRKENDEGTFARKVMIREMGFGLNKHISLEHPLFEVSSFERKLGYHVSMGMKHPIYRRKTDKKVVQRYHIDVFVDVKKILIDDAVVFENSAYIV